MKTLGVTLPVVARSTSTSLGGVAGTSRDCRDGSTPVQFAVMQMGCHVDAVRRMLQQMASTGSDSCSSARASRRSGFSVSRRCHFHPGHSAFDHRPSGQVRRLADGRRLVHRLAIAAGQGRKPEARPRHGAADLLLTPEPAPSMPSPTVARRRPPSPAVARRRRRSSPSSRGRAVACATMGVRACRVDGHGRARWGATRRPHTTRSDS